MNEMIFLHCRKAASYAGRVAAARTKSTEKATAFACLRTSDDFLSLPRKPATKSAYEQAHKLTRPFISVAIVIGLILIAEGCGSPWIAGSFSI